MNGTESRFPLLRYLSLLVVSMSSLAALLAVITLLVSFTKPEWGTMGLFEVSGIVFRIGFVSIFAAIGIGAGSSYLLRSKRELRSRFEKQFGRFRVVLKAIVAIAALLMAVTLIQRFTFVKHTNGKWISTSRAGSREIPEIVARDYLWRLIRFSSLFLFVSSCSTGLQSGSILRVLGSSSEGNPNSEMPYPAG